MHRYELLLLTIPEITEDEVKSLESQLDQLIKEVDGTIISFERWGKYKLAYPIRKNDYGVYFLVRFEVDNPHPLLGTIQSLMSIKLSNIVMRNMVTALSLKETLAYQRSPSLEETPLRDVDSFLKEHKMEGLLSPMKPRATKTTPYKKKENINLEKIAATKESEKE
ncbi:30S ribosomal protein S6 [Candidatus Dependentiae bacterium]|nr:MAG: 30S ribosomal protein S6 [Candidatus Dependentiae bacterium]